MSRIQYLIMGRLPFRAINRNTSGMTMFLMTTTTRSMAICWAASLAMSTTSPILSPALNNLSANDSQLLPAS